MQLQKHIQDALTCISKATIGQEVAVTFCPDGLPIPKEGALWDYKAAFDNEKISYAEVVKDILSFYNSYGGYLFIGIEELKTDENFQVCGFRKPDEFVIKLRAAVESYASRVIDFTVFEFFINELVVTGVHIPKRSVNLPPAFLVRAGPEKKAGKVLFNEKSTYFRENDRTIQALIPSQWEFLNSGRRYEDLQAAPMGLSAIAVNTRNIPHNLPDKNLICAHLFGREDLIVALWAWVADDLEPVRLLAGAGGKGKTSIAYEFASHFFRKAPEPFVQVFWASAKKRQFLPERNDYMDLPECLYSNPVELLIALAVATAAITEDERATGEHNEYTLQRKLRDSLRILPSLVVIDDIDSLPPSDQKRVFELTQQMAASTPSKFLLTTRANFAFSDSQCILVPGLRGDPYKSFVQDRMQRLGIEKVKTADIKRLEIISDGSPLWTDSILRLIKQGRTLVAALSEWQGKPGEDARAAALEKELNALSAPAKRILYVASILQSSSRAELLEVTGTGRVEFDEAISQLQTFFLVDAPKIIDKEPRFSVPESTALAVSELGRKMVPDHQRLAYATRELQRTSIKRAAKPRTQVAFVVSQTMALLRAGKHDDAFETVEASLKSQSKDPDLLLLRGRCLLAMKDSKAAEAFSDAYNNNQRKPLLFELWHEASARDGHTAACLDISNLALDAQCDLATWLPYRARAKVEIGLTRSREGNNKGAVDMLGGAADDLGKTLAQLSLSDNTRVAIRGNLVIINDMTWKLVNSASGIEADLIAFDAAKKALELGDIRLATAERLMSVTLSLTIPAGNSHNSPAFRAGQLRLRAAIDTLDAAASKLLASDSLKNDINAFVTRLRAARRDS